MKRCTVEGCGNKHAAKGLCRKHYMRVRNNGTLDRQDGAEPFEQKYVVDAATGCWNWIRGKDKDGYGKVKVGGRSFRAHRYSWELRYGLSASGTLLCHRCDNPSCVNPDHLFPGDHAVNHADRNQKGRTASGERSGLAKLTAAAVLEIRQTRPGYRAAAAKFGIGKTQYHRILRGQNWSDLNVI